MGPRPRLRAGVVDRRRHHPGQQEHHRPAPAGPPPLLTPLSCRPRSPRQDRPTNTVLSSVKASMAGQPPSRPRPDVLKPPKGALGATANSLMPTVPARRARATRNAFLITELHPP